MVFGLCKSPVFRQYLINDILLDFLYCLVPAYLDHIFIYSMRLKDYCLYVKQLFECLPQAKLHANINKCKFYVIKTKFMNLIIYTKVLK